MLPSDYHARIGHVVMAFERLERNLSSVLTGYISPNILVGIIITQEIGFRELVRLIKTIYMQLHGEDQDFVKLRQILEDVKEVKTLRDKMVHSSFTHVSDPDKEIEHIHRFKVTAKERHGYRRHTEKITLDDLDKMIARIDAVNSALLDWHIELIKVGKTPYVRMAC
jgi:hypothetical protein